jgi:hypothetical protein
MLLLKNRLLLIGGLSVLLCFSLFTSVKAETMMWSKTTQEIMGYSLVEAADGGYALAGTTGSNCWLGKFDVAGNVEWNQTYGGGGCRSLIATSDNGYALAGTSEPFGLETGDFWLIKTDADGNMEWNKTHGESGYIEGCSLTSTSHGGYAFAGFTDSFGAGGYDVWLIKTDSLGDMEWNMTYAEEKAHWTYSLIATSDGGYAMASQTYLDNGGIVLIKTDEFGVVPEALWIIFPLLAIATVSVLIIKRNCSITLHRLVSILFN